MQSVWGVVLGGFAAGIVNGLFSAGGGMVLVPTLSQLHSLEESQLFPASISIILPVSLLSLFLSAGRSSISFSQALPYLLGSGTGGALAGIFGDRIPNHWLHRCLGVLILWGGVRYLC